MALTLRTGIRARSQNMTSFKGHYPIVILQMDAHAPIWQSFLNPAVEDQKILVAHDLRQTEG